MYLIKDNLGRNFPASRSRRATLTRQEKTRRDPIVSDNASGYLFHVLQLIISSEEKAGLIFPWENIMQCHARYVSPGKFGSGGRWSRTDEFSVIDGFAKESKIPISRGTRKNLSSEVKKGPDWTFGIVSAWRQPQSVWKRVRKLPTKSAFVLIFKRFAAFVWWPSLQLRSAAPDWSLPEK